MKTPSTELFDLVHSLRQNEKRYFNVFAKTLGGSSAKKNYTELFSQLSKQEEYDERYIRNKKIGVKHFKRLKHYTSGMVMRSLENFHGESSAEIIVNRFLTQAEILYRKKQYSLLRKVLSKAFAMAVERDMLQYINPLLLFEFKASISLRNTTHTLHQFTSKALLRITKDCGRWMELRRLDVMFWNIIQTRDIVTAREKQELRAIASNAIKVLGSGNNSYSISREASNVLGLCYRFSGDTQKSYFWRKKLIEVIEKDKKFLHERSAEYVVAIGNLLNLCLEMKMNDDVEKLFHKANDYVSVLPTKYIDQALDDRFCNLQNSYISFLFANKKYEEAIHYGEILYNKLRKHSYDFINSLVPLLLRTIVFSAFYTRNFKMANRYYNLWLRQDEPAIDQLWKKLFGLVLFFEQGERDLLFYRCRAFRYALRKEKKTNPFMYELEKFISGKILKTINKKEEAEAFRIFFELISKKGKIIDSAKSAGYFNYADWLKMKN